MIAVLVEGISDRIALETLAACGGRDLAAEGVAVVPIGGAQAVRRAAADFGPEVRLVGLCDAGEARVFERVERLRFHVCVADLEDELIRALGADGVEAVLEREGDAGSFRTFQKQPAWRPFDAGEQLRGFLHSSDRRKLRYARLLVEELGPERAPAPLQAVLRDAA